MPQPGTVSDDPGSWVAVRVDVAADAADAVGNFLFESGAPAVLVRDDAAPGRAALEATVRAADAAGVVAAVGRYLASLAAMMVDVPAGTLTTAPVADVDWAAEARTHHRPVAVGRRLLVAPPWQVPPAAGRLVLVLEPGMAFGTGQHGSTRGCLEAIEALVDAGNVATALDVGTGSGLLAMALARLGVARVVALDVDAAVLPIARANLGDGGGVRLLAGTVRAVRGRFDLVVANLLADVLVAAAEDLAAVVGPAGALVVSGLLAEQAPAVERAFGGFHRAGAYVVDGWTTLTLVRA
jgi:ribosomal protein L11 methyltransferase